MIFRELSAIDEVPAAEWNALGGSDCPFLRHEFLAAQEHTRCVGPQTGWTPVHLVLLDVQGRLRAAAPCYRKQHSWGEFVFDFSWAQAYARHGLAYYPKLLVGVPFSPINNSRLLLHPEAAPQTRDLLAAELERRCTDQGISSVHATFIDAADRAAFQQRGWLLRSDVQFHWHNRGYADFEAYLATFRSEKRKQARRERRRIAESGITVATLRGPQLDEAALAFVYGVHARTFHAHGHEPYLNLDCFRRIAATLGDALMVKLALQGPKPVAAAVFLAGPDALYGRYWGAMDEFHSLHFELCYHQGIEFCIEQGLARFEPGTQGEHKIARGFEPSHTWSAHYIADPRFREAIGDFLQRESAQVDAYAEAVAAHVPFHRE